MFRVIGLLLVGFTVAACYTIPVDKNTYILEQYSSADCVIMRTVKILEDGKAKIALKKEGPNNCGAFKKSNNLVFYLRNTIFLV